MLAGDHTATGLDGAGWSVTDGTWWSSAAFSRGMRTDPALRDRVVAVHRRTAEAVYRRISGEDLPGEAALRGRFHDRLPLDDSAPLLLGSPEVPEGFRERRVYRVLFAGDLDAERLRRLRCLWAMGPADGSADPPARVAGTARLRAGRDVLTWDLRRIGPGTAWCLDLTACLGGSSDDTVGSLLRELRTAMRHDARLIPVTIERFA
ncbi:hypothetical protein ACFFMN_06590 [Planobispora siamensis]|uniref:Uncharacterized protein n=1 Tax=Planobispora siamensis TaxID=936338 RepID=A0A8J3SNK8_9ACTN|nr:hypothetical protein [Planobispora siamensis]GIH95604.1 hypothetical protein Psi01_62340 [Planobispora siamensis]